MMAAPCGASIGSVADAVNGGELKDRVRTGRSMREVFKSHDYLLGQFLSLNCGACVALLAI
jgi:hypothetical protein